jgi:hypothetical protein
MSLYDIAARSEVEVPLDPIETKGEWSNTVRRMQPTHWAVTAGTWRKEGAAFYLVGTKITKSGRPYDGNPRLEMKVALVDVPMAARRDLAEQVQVALDAYVVDRRRMIAELLEGAERP